MGTFIRAAKEQTLEGFHLARRNGGHGLGVFKWGGTMLVVGGGSRWRTEKSSRVLFVIGEGDLGGGRETPDGLQKVQTTRPAEKFVTKDKGSTTVKEKKKKKKKSKTGATPMSHISGGG